MRSRFVPVTPSRFRKTASSAVPMKVALFTTQHQLWAVAGFCSLPRATELN